MKRRPSKRAPRRHLALVPAPSRTDAVDPPAGSILAVRPDLRAAVQDFAEKSEARNSHRARRADWTVFTAWCAEHRAQALPASSETLAAFLADQAKGAGERSPKAAATVARYAQSVHKVHALRKCDSPLDAAVRTVLQGIRRERGVRPTHKAALTAELLASALGKYEATLRGRPLRRLRDRVILLLGLASALRRESLCALDVEHLHVVEGGLIIDLRKSKTDQEGAGRPVAVAQLDEPFAAYCPVRAVEAWCAATKRTAGPLLSPVAKGDRPGTTRLDARCVATVVKAAAKAAGLDPALFGAHSLRAGYVTTARQQGVDWAAIMEQTGHRRLETAKLYARYTPDVFVATRAADVFRGAFAQPPPDPPDPDPDPDAA